MMLGPRTVLEDRRDSPHPRRAAAGCVVFDYAPLRPAWRNRWPGLGAHANARVGGGGVGELGGRACLGRGGAGFYLPRRSRLWFRPTESGRAVHPGALRRPRRRAAARPGQGTGTAGRRGGRAAAPATRQRGERRRAGVPARVGRAVGGTWRLACCASDQGGWAVRRRRRR